MPYFYKKGIIIFSRNGTCLEYKKKGNVCAKAYINIRHGKVEIASIDAKPPKQGFGTILLKFIIKYFKKKGYIEIKGEVWLQNASYLIPWYHNNGFYIIHTPDSNVHFYMNLKGKMNLL